MTITPGKEYKLLTTQSSADGRATIYAGQVVKVRELVDAATKGAGRDDEDSVVVDFEVQGEVINDDGERVLGNCPRATAFSVDNFSNLFEAV